MVLAIQIYDYDTFHNPQLFSYKQQAKVEKAEQEFYKLLKRRSPDAIAASQDFLKFRQYVCQHDTFEHMLTWHHELNTGQDNKYLRGIAGEDVCILAPRNSSKSQPVGEVVLTPSGWVRMGDIKVGDYVISADGTPTTVIGVHPQGIKDTYKVTFDDGAECECSLDHLWQYRNPFDGKTYVKSLAEIIEKRTFDFYRIPKYKSEKGSRRFYSVEKTTPQEHQCISVDHPSQLYITRDYIVTHNSTFLLQWVAYVIGTHVMQGISLKILYISYAVDAAIGKSRQIKAIIQSEPYQEVFPKVRKSPSKWGEGEWAIDFEYAGLSTIQEAYTVVCAGLKGSINSRRAHLAIIDDPQKDIDEARNKSIQDRMESNYNNILKYTRYDGSRFITLGTRMAKHDAYARIFVPPYYKIITQKALIEEKQPDGSIIERSFWEPANDDAPGLRIATLIKEREEDEESFLLQRQNELPETTVLGIKTNWIKYSWMPKRFDRIVIGIDTAESMDENTNATAMVVVGIANDCLYVIDAYEGKIQGSLKKIDTIYDLWLKRKADCKHPAILAVDHHSHSLGLEGDMQSYIDDIHLDESLDQGFANISVEKIKSTGRGEKIDRLLSHSYYFEKGRVFFNLISPKTDGGIELIPRIVNQITDYNPIDHNDLMDALEVTIYVARQYITGSISVA